jgi:hypothetical protein
VIQIAIDEKETAAQLRSKQMVQFELTTMFYESYCDYSIYFDFAKDNYWDTQILYRKDKRNQEYIKLSNEEILKRCGAIKHFKKNKRQ